MQCTLNVSSIFGALENRPWHPRLPVKIWGEDKQVADIFVIMIFNCVNNSVDVLTLGYL